MNYRLAYQLGFHPWEDAEHHAPFVDKIGALFDREEAGRQPPYGPALDVGTGSGIWAIQLAQRGWQVTGIDLVEKALRRARDRVSEADADVRLVRGDATALRAAGVGTGFRLVLDTGTFHGLTAEQRKAMGQEVSAVAAPNATVLMIAWPKRHRPLIRGVSQSDIKAAFPGWTVTEAGASGFQAPKPLDLLLRPDEHWYRMHRE